MRDIKGLFINIIFIVAAIVVANFAAQFALGFFTGIGGNIRVIGLDKIAFDPLITIAYVLLYYFITLFYQPAPKVQYYMFLITLFLSFTVNFIQGAMFLVFFHMILRKLRVI